MTSTETPALLSGLRIERFDSEAAWLARRRQLITSTDVAAIVGQSPWATPLSVYADKVLASEGPKDAPQLRRGRKLEGYVASEYAEREGVELIDGGGRPWIIVHPVHDWLGFSPDRLIVRGGQLASGLECKTSRTREGWEAPDLVEDGVPPAYVIQCAIGRACTGFDLWVLAAMLGSLDDLTVYQLRRHLAYEEWLIAQAAEFRERHILRREPPAYDGSAGGEAVLRLQFPRDARPDLRRVNAGDAVHADMLALRAARAEAEDAEERKAVLEQRIKAAIGDCAGLSGEGWRCTWKSAKATDKTDWTQVAGDLQRRLAVEVGEQQAAAETREILAAHTKTTPGARRFLATWTG